MISKLKNLQCSVNNFTQFLDKIHSLSFKYFYNFKAHKVFNAIFTHKDIKSLESLAANKEIIVCKPDKGRGVVLLDKAMYLSKITELI